MIARFCVDSSYNGNEHRSVIVIAYLFKTKYSQKFQYEYSNNYKKYYCVLNLGNYLFFFFANRRVIYNTDLIKYLIYVYVQSIMLDSDRSEKKCISVTSIMCTLFCPICEQNKTIIFLLEILLRSNTTRRHFCSTLNLISVLKRLLLDSEQQILLLQ